MNRIVIGLAGLAAIVSSTPLLAQVDDALAPSTRAVSLSGFDLSNAAGQARARRHIAWAANSVCDPSLTGDLRRWPEVARCRKEARGDAMRQLDTQIARANLERNEVMVASIAP